MMIVMTLQITENKAVYLLPKLSGYIFSTPQAILLFFLQHTTVSILQHELCSAYAVSKSKI